MNNPLFSKITSDYYVRHYEIDPKFTKGLQVTVYAECAPNTEGVNGHYYYLDIYLSVNNIAVLDHVVGVTFGEGQMDQRHLDAAIDCQRQFEIVRKRRRNFVVFRRGGNKTKRFLAQKECSRFAVSDA